MAPGETDPHTLAGAYVLEAVGEDDRSRFEAHLDGCPECRAEVRELHEAAARLGMATGVRPRPELRERAIRAARRTSQLAPVIANERPAGGAAGAQAGAASPPGGAARRTHAARRWLAAAAGVAVLAGGAALGLSAHDAMRQVHASRRRDHLIAMVLSAPDAVLRSGAVSTGGTAMVVLSHREHMGVFTAHGLRSLPGGEAYELWVMAPRGVRPAGMLGPAADGMAGPVVIAGMAPGDMVGLTVEPASGAHLPTARPLVVLGPAR